jgi:hypothetical protein
MFVCVGSPELQAVLNDRSAGKGLMGLAIKNQSADILIKNSILLRKDFPENRRSGMLCS